jgi:uncharacterized Zn-finger protein
VQVLSQLSVRVHWPERAGLFGPGEVRPRGQRARLSRFAHSTLDLTIPRPDPTAVKAIPANAENRYEVTRADLPLSCPMPGMYLWNSHPRVYLPIEASGRAKCPYCGAEYVLVD